MSPTKNFVPKGQSIDQSTTRGSAGVNHERSPMKGGQGKRTPPGKGVYGKAVTGPPMVVTSFQVSPFGGMRLAFDKAGILIAIWIPEHGKIIICMTNGVSEAVIAAINCGFNVFETLPADAAHTVRLNELSGWVEFQTCAQNADEALLYVNSFLEWAYREKVNVKARHFIVEFIHDLMVMDESMENEAAQAYLDKYEPADDGLYEDERAREIALQNMSMDAEENAHADADAEREALRERYNQPVVYNEYGWNTMASTDVENAWWEALWEAVANGTIEEFIRKQTENAAAEKIAECLTRTNESRSEYATALEGARSGDLSVMGSWVYASLLEEQEQPVVVAPVLVEEGWNAVSRRRR
jgi:hypothetical protein